MAAERSIQKKGIRRKFIITICLSTLIAMSLGIGIWYFFNLNMMYDSVGEIHRKMAQMLADDVSSRLQRIADDLSADPVFRQALEKGALAEAEKGPAAISGRIREYVAKASDIAEITLVNKIGFVVASSAKMPAAPEASGGLYGELISNDRKTASVGDIDFDSALNMWVIPLSVPLADTSGRPLGLIQAKLAAKRIFAPVGDFRIDSTGHAFVIDSKGSVMFHPGETPVNVRPYSAGDYEKLMTAQGKYAVVEDPGVHKKKMFVALSEVAPRVLLDSGRAWKVLVDQDVSEIFSPLGRIAPRLALAVALLLLVMVAIGSVFGGILVRPIEKLYAAAVKIKEGNWDYNIDIKTRDEIEQFADAFKEMVSNIKGKQSDLLKAKAELEKFSKSLEDKVNARTVDLTMAKDKIDNYAKELEKAITVKSDFISMASHEMRTPLAAMKEGINIVLSGKAGELAEKQRDFLDLAKRNLERLSKIINDILDFQKLEQGKMVIRPEENDINEVITETCRTMANLAAEKGLELVTKEGRNIPRFRFDKDRIAQVLINLIGNAIKFTQTGTITVSSALEGDSVKVSVKDTGIGIKEEDIPRLFQKFMQLEKGLERRPGGTGLGLVISKEIIEKHSGRIWAEPKLGKGATFCFVLPLSNAAGERAERETT